MLPVSPVILVFAFIMMLVIGFAMGSLSGFVMMRVRNNDRRGWWKDGLLGMASYVSVFALLIYITAMHRIESWIANPALGSFLAAILIPAIHEWLRSSRPRT